MFKRAIVQGEIEEWGGRRTKLEFEKTSYDTPNRIVNSTEIAARDRLTLITGFDVPIVECTSRLRADFPDRFARANGTFKRTKERLVRFKTNHKGKDVIFRPQLPTGSYFDKRGIKMLLDMQSEANLSIITIPELPPDLSGEQYSKCIRSAVEYCAKSSAKKGLTFMPYLAMGMEHQEKFEERLKFLIRLANDRCDLAIGVRLASYDEFRPNYESINEYNVRDNDIWIHSSGALDYSSRGGPSARQHIPQRFGIDTSALLVKSAPGKKPTAQISDDVVASAMGYIRLFNNPTVEYLRATDLPAEALENTRCECKVCDGKTITEGIRTFVTDEGGADEGNIRDYIRLHNANMSFGEFDVSREMTEEQSLEDYFKTKKGLKPFSE